MKEKQYAFYVLRSDFASVMDAIEKGCVASLRIGEYIQEDGEDVSYHGSPVYEQLTTITNTETKEVFHHNNYDKYNQVDFIPFKDVQNRLEWAINRSETDSKKLLSQLNMEKLKQDYIVLANAEIKKMQRAIYLSNPVMIMQ